MSTETLATLHQAIATMSLPEQKKTSTDMQDLRWLGRNMGIQNAQHPQFQNAAAALKELGVRFVIGS